jgi:hypothetical protein
VNKIPSDAHEWVTFDDEKLLQTYRFDVTFLESNWTCIFGRGCQGVLTGPTEELVQGCCSYGAHFSDEKDVQRVIKSAKRLTSDQWQFKDKAKNGVTKTNKKGETTTRLVKDACIFLNRPDFHRGPGCALHVLSLDTGESYIPLKPEVCWQLPLRRDESTDEAGRVTTTIGQWNREHWGAGGEEFHWWCTQSREAFISKTRVFDGMKEELIAMTSSRVYDRLGAYLAQRAAQPSSTRLAHPMVRRKA